MAQLVEQPIRNQQVRGSSPLIGSRYRGVAQFGSAFGSGPKGRGFESRHFDHKNPKYPLWVLRIFAIRNDGERIRGGRGKRGKCQPGGLSGEAGNAPSLLARKGERNPLQGFRATIERTVSNPSANSIVATPHCRACSLEFDLSSDEIPATGGRQSFAHFDSRKR